jgi:hypothetical protein
MIAGGEKLQAVAEELVDWSGSRTAVQRAAECYWSAAFWAAEWPADLRARHEQISALLFSEGVARDTVARISDAAVAHLVDELRSFARDALAASPVSQRD